MSEFPCYSFEDLAGVSVAKLKILYGEALRQRTAKSELLATCINKAHQDKQTQRDINKEIKRGLNPHKIIHEVKEVSKERVDAGWDQLRRKRR